jgi:hypothetical protein
MTTQDPSSALALLEQQPLKFEAKRGLDQLHRNARLILQASHYRAPALMSYTGVDVSALTAEGLDAAIELAVRAGLQTAVEARRLNLYVLWPASGRFFALPADALVSPFRFTVAIDGQPVAGRAQHLGEETWRTGQLFGPDCHPTVEPLAASCLRVFVTDVQARAVLRTLDRPQPFGGGPERDEGVRRTILRLREERGGRRLSVREGETLLMELHNLSRTDARRLLEEAQGPAPLGRPRKVAAEES